MFLMTPVFCTAFAHVCVTDKLEGIYVCGACPSPSFPRFISIYDQHKKNFFLKGDRINRNRLRPIWSSIGYRFGLSEDVNYYATSSWELFTQGASDQFPGPHDSLQCRFSFTTLQVGHGGKPSIHSCHGGGG